MCMCVYEIGKVGKERFYYIPNNVYSGIGEGEENISCFLICKYTDIIINTRVGDMYKVKSIMLFYSLNNWKVIKKK